MMAASSKMVVVSTTNSDLPRRESICSLSTLMADNDDDHHKHPSITMDDILKNIYSSTATTDDVDDNDHHQQHQQHQHHAEARSVDDVWKEIVAGGVGVGMGEEEEEGAAEGDGGDQVRAGEGGGGGGMEEMTLEDFLTRARAVREEDVNVTASGVPIGYGQFQVQPPPPPPPPAAQGQLVYANGTTSGGGGGGGGGGGRAGKRRVVQEAPLDKATQQKQRRMIKNRESAARSRERKQAYTVELEALVTQLEEENARLLRQQAEQRKERFKRLMENLIPIVEKRRPPRVLRRVHSVQW